MEINEYCEKIEFLCTQRVDDINDNCFASKIINNNEIFDALYQINEELLVDKDKMQKVYLKLLRHKDERIKIWVATNCLINGINILEAKLVIKKLKWFSKSPFIRFEALMVWKEWKKGNFKKIQNYLKK